MKTSCLLILMISGLFCNCVAQSQSARPAFYPRQYVVKVQFTSRSETQKGVLYDLTDSTMLLAPIGWTKSIMKTMIKQHGGTLPPTDSLRQVLPLRTYRYADISRLTVHRRGSAAKGFLIGAGIGAVGSVVSLLIVGDRLGGDWNFFPTTYSTPSRSTPLQKGLNMLATTLSLGALGLPIGAAPTKHIDAKQKLLSVEAKKRFREYTIVDQVNRATLYSRYR